MLIKYILPVALLLTPISSWAQTCNSASPESTPDSRFTDQSDGTVLDTLTTLVWKRCSEGQTWNSGTSSCTGNTSTFTWLGAQTRVNTVNTSGYASQTDWRLPNLSEMRSIIEHQCRSPAINGTIFPNTQGTNFWTSSPVAYSSRDYSAWYVNFYYGPASDDLKSEANAVRLVRAGS